MQKPKYTLENMKGKRFGKLVVVGPEVSERSETTGKLRRYIWCKCDCGNMYKAIIADLASGRYNSCGCEERKSTFKKIQSKGNTKHGMKHTKLYSVWCNMKTRCYNTRADNYKYYGALMIEVCDEWKNSFEAFAKWAMENGYQEGLELDRLDTTKDYKPSNCRWTSRQYNANSRTNNRYLTYKGKEYTISECAKMIGYDNTKLVNYCNTHRLFTSLEEVIDHNNNIGFHHNDGILDALIFIDESKLEYNKPKKNFFMK